MGNIILNYSAIVSNKTKQPTTNILTLKINIIYKLSLPMPRRMNNAYVYRMDRKSKIILSAHNSLKQQLDYAQVFSLLCARFSPKKKKLKFFTFSFTCSVRDITITSQKKKTQNFSPKFNLSDRNNSRSAKISSENC